jgi:hypothetical protein
MAITGGVAGLPVAAPPDFTAEVRWRRGLYHGEGLGRWEKAQASSG